MSRTDAHVPVPVRIVRGDLAAVADHNHATGECDLPPRGHGVGDWRATTRCRWIFLFTGTFVCPCEMCHAGGAHRAERRRSRHDTAASARRAVRRWNSGDRLLE
ncbi:hypothetical protein GCM10025768_23060 [Microbacterium pseudoresistens]|uniref:Uncharacterized protein n=1 Tax=Microbacterium pseudoresistens TaxID=640634 RepID=A0A7Y9JM38_9MICO|nr:hypothetical protein [Microbacterium pseudoresistens]NYD53601.1 hypothetical protein [Microbacterium pseudoresistens]